MKKVIELIRVSTLSQAGDDRASIPAQKTANRKTAATYGLTIIKSIEMTDVSGTAVLRAPEMQDLLRLIESPDIDGVVVREFSRVMRPDNFGDYVLFQVFQDTGTLLYLPDGPLDLNSKTGKLMAGLRAIIAGNELSEIRERVWSAKEEMRRAGKNPGGDIVLPFGIGYTKEQGYFLKPEAELVREAFRRLLAGETSYTELAKPLGFTPQGMHTIFTNPIYTGWRVYDKKRDMASNARRYCAGGRQWQFMNRESKRRILAVTVPEIRVSNYQVRGISVTSPVFCGVYETRPRAGSLIATPTPERIFIPLNL